MFVNFDSALNLPFNSANVFEPRYKFLDVELLNKEPFQTKLGGKVVRRASRINGHD
jgi:hypothetical protein